MKAGKRIRKKALVLLAVFVAAAIFYFIWPMRQGKESGTVSYTAMAQPTLPVVFPRMLGREMAPLYGHKEERAVTADRDSLLVLPADRRLSLRLEGAGRVAALGYEIRSLDMEHLVERTELTGWKNADGTIELTLPIQNLLEKEQEYSLGLNVRLAEGESVWYYARIVDTDNEHVEEMLTLAEEFSQKSMNYEAAQSLTMYMESSAGADNSTFGTVTLKNSFTQITWGKLGVSRPDRVFLMLKELSGNLANVQLEYRVRRQDEDGAGEELYTITENFTLRWATQRIYMMDFEREMNQFFTGERELFSGRRILLGINSGRDLYAKKSIDEQVIAFVVNRELWAFDRRKEAGNDGLFSHNNGRSIRVFSFGGADEADMRAANDAHGIEILEVAQDGNIDFLVYGYMNRGTHEGETGVSYYRYHADNNALEEKFFLPASVPYGQLKLDVETLAHKGANGILYLYMNETVYGIDLTSYEYVVVASGLTNDKFSVSRDGTRLAWQEDTGVYASGVLHIMDLDTGEKTQLGGEDGEICRILGFLGNDCVYGIGEAGDSILSNGRIKGTFLKRLEIVDRAMGRVKSYEKTDSWIRSVWVDESRIHIENVYDKNSGFFAPTVSDTLVCNVDALPGRMDDIGWYASEEKGRVYFVQLSADIAADDKLRLLSPEKLAAEDTAVLTVEASKPAEVMEFYAYGRGRYLGRFVDFCEAAATAYEYMGFVTAGKDEVIWVRGNKANSYHIRDISVALRRLERNREGFVGNARAEDESLMLDLSGCTLNQALYFVGRGMPVLAYTGEGEYLYLTGYDQVSVRIYDPVTSGSETWEIESAEEYFSLNGNDFICCLFSN
ncbi:MAG: hypothetical protein HFE84_09345 [Lachnospiraceae bacterium]|nr:hypothetical protein [Lachnospiraceae bacterium]